MSRGTQQMIKGACVGMAAGAAMAAAGSYIMYEHPKEMKRAMKKMSHQAEKAVQELDKLLQSH